MLRELFADALFLAHLELMVPCQLAIREPFLVGDVFENLELILHFLEIKVRCAAAHRTALSSVFNLSLLCGNRPGVRPRLTFHHMGATSGLRTSKATWLRRC